MTPISFLTLPSLLYCLWYLWSACAECGNMSWYMTILYNFQIIFGQIKLQMVYWKHILTTSCAVDHYSLMNYSITRRSRMTEAALICLKSSLWEQSSQSWGYMLLCSVLQAHCNGLERENNIWNELHCLTHAKSFCFNVNQDTFYLLIFWLISAFLKLNYTCSQQADDSQ